MKPFKPVWGWTKNTSYSPVQGFFSSFLCPKFFPSYVPPSLHFLLLHLQSSEELLNLNSTKLWGDMRHKAWGRWRGKGKKSASSQMWKQKKRGKLPCYSAFFLLYVFFLFSTWKEDATIFMPRVNTTTIAITCHYLPIKLKIVLSI